ncbi:SIS domain-containing protein [Nonomuraea maheshkhaliensis]|uniref:SIS domain-containing protein n=1 Tax=Nonomuraea maheshkhaliensis TaxID=419590 RepID=A0ABN2H9N5_9ACTN
MSDLLDPDRLESDLHGSDRLGSDRLGRARAERAAPGAALARDAAEIVRAARAMAERFGRGGRLLAFGAPADAAHVAVEFTHPVIVGKRALPALAVDTVRLRTLGRPEDIAIGIGIGDGGVLETARGLGMLTVVLAADHGGVVADHGGVVADHGGVVADHVLVARTTDPLVARELHVTTYHLLWELVHVFLESS